MYVSTSLRQYVKQKRKREETETETETYSYASIGDVDDSGLSVCIAGSLSLRRSDLDPASRPVRGPITYTTYSEYVVYRKLQLPSSK